MTIRDIGLGIKALLDWIGRFFQDWQDVLIWQTNWLDANILHVLMSLGVYCLIPMSIWAVITDSLQHRRKLKDDEQYREKWELAQQLRAEEIRLRAEENRAKDRRALKFLFGFLILFVAFLFYIGSQEPQL